MSEKCEACEHGLYCTHEYKQANNKNGDCVRFAKGEKKMDVEKNSTGLVMKYFVLNPNKKNEYGQASRMALLAYADQINATNPILAKDLRIWQAKTQQESESE